MTVFAENDVVRVLSPFESDVIGERRSVVVPGGSVGTVVLVLGAPTCPCAYEIEFFIAEQNCYALATVDASALSYVLGSES